MKRMRVYVSLHDYKNIAEALEESSVIEIESMDREAILLSNYGKCDQCGEIGNYCYDPYYEDVNNEKVPICLCETCYKESVNDI